MGVADGLLEVEVCVRFLRCMPTSTRQQELPPLYLSTRSAISPQPRRRKYPTQKSARVDSASDLRRSVTKSCSMFSKMRGTSLTPTQQYAKTRPKWARGVIAGNPAKVKPETWNRVNDNPGERPGPETGAVGAAGVRHELGLEVAGEIEPVDLRGDGERRIRSQDSVLGSAGAGRFRDRKAATLSDRCRG